MERIVEKFDCFGCGACVLKCPHKCIAMKEEKNGFKYAVVNSKECTDCRLCKKVCPSKNNFNVNMFANDKIICFAGIIKDEKKLLSSSSGGAFTAISEVFFSRGDAAIIGAEIDDCVVKHNIANNISEINAFKKSKYAQSEIGNCYKKTKELLESKKQVIFTGTPCQIMGLKNFLEIEYKNLLCVDLICTGVGSPGLLKKFIDYVEDEKNKSVMSFDMRYKFKENNQWKIMNTQITYTDGTMEESKLTNLFKGCFGQHLCFRETCYHCVFAKLPRVGDITIGDWWGGINQFNNIHEDKGTSVILFNNEKGTELISKLNDLMYLKKVELDDILKQNPTLTKSTKKPARAIGFWRAYENKSIEKVLLKYAQPPLKIRMFSKISSLLPSKISIALKRIYYAKFNRS